jgi:hypothetical protein
MISIVPGRIYIATNSVLGIFFPCILPAFVIFCFLDGSHQDWGEMESQCSFDLHFSGGYIFRILFFIYHWLFLLYLLRSICLLHLLFLFIVLLFLLVLTFMSSLHILYSNHRWKNSWQRHCLIILVIVSFALQKLFFI